MTSEVWFYHLEKQPKDKILPDLLQKALERDWRVIVACGDAETCESLNQSLWDQGPESFIPHGRWDGPSSEDQPISLYHGDQLPPGSFEMFVSLAPLNLPDINRFARTLILFEGQDDAHLNWARGQWSQLKKDGLPMSYWRQDENGRWQKLHAT